MGINYNWVGVAIEVFPSLLNDFGEILVFNFTRSLTSKGV
jgi:hypothetical protein